MKLRGFGTLKKLLSKGHIFYFKKYSFSSEPEKPRSILILNENPPRNENDIVYWVPLKSDYEKALQYATSIEDVHVIKDKELKEESAFSLDFWQVDPAKQLIKKYDNDNLIYKSKLSDDSIFHINNYIKRYLENKKKARTIPQKMKEVILG